MDGQVVIVGGGISGSALARSLAAAGRDVLVLEASEVFEDRVRGESMQVWGVAEAEELDVLDVLLDAGAHIAPLWKQYAQGIGEPVDIPMSIMREGIDGSLNLRHPDACQALLDAAVAAGATVVRGVRDVTLAPGSVTYRVGEDERSAPAGLVVGADGRASTVRRQTGITLERSDAITYIAGLLVDGLDGVPDDHDVMAFEADRIFLLFHQGDGRARSYIVTGLAEKQLFGGAGAAERFLDACRLSAYPWSDAVTSATPAGPCAAYAGDDTWTATPYADGVVLIGDAAGYNDPIIGQGLSIGLRDARSVRDIVLGDGGSPDFRPYGEERVERMRRLRLIADVLGVVNAEDADNRAARQEWFGSRVLGGDVGLFMVMMASFAGPETVPEELVDEGLLDRIRSA